MNKEVILRALERIEEASDPEEIANAVAIIRLALAPVERLKPEDYFAVKFEAGGKYMVFVNSAAVDATALRDALQCDSDPGYELMFVFTWSNGRPVKDNFLVVDGKIFADSRCMEQVDGVTLVDTGGRPISEVMECS